MPSGRYDYSNDDEAAAPSGYDYGESDGMREALERARTGAGDVTEATRGPMVLPEMDFTEQSPKDPELETQFGNGATPPKETTAGHAARKAAEYDEEGDYSPHKFSAPPMPPVNPAKQADDEYTAALRRIKGILSRPAPDYSKGYADAQQQDTSENRSNRIMDYLSAGLRRASAPNLSPAATHASDFLKQQAMTQHNDDSEASRAGRLASILKPAKTAAGKDAGNVEGLRSYLVKVGAGTAEELAGMSESQLKAAFQMFGLKHKIDREPVDDKFKQTFHDDNVASTEATRAQTLALANRTFADKNQDQVSNDAKALSEKLGDKAVFDKRYSDLQGLIKANGGKVPGLGMLEGVRQQPGIIGSAVRAVSPPSPEAVRGRKLLRQLAADYARVISGAGVSDKERAVLNSATVDVDNDDSAIALAGLESLKEMYDAKAGQIKKGYRPEAVRQVTGDEPPPPAATAESRTIDGVTYRKNAAGKWVTDG